MQQLASLFLMFYSDGEVRHDTLVVEFDEEVHDERNKMDALLHN
jgi:hypothetical protein